MSTIILGIRKGFKHRRKLAKLLSTTPSKQTIFQLTPKLLSALEVQALALDFDGVLAPHAVDQLSPEVEQWLQNCCQLVGAEKIVILSNRPTAARKEMLERCFSGLRLVTGTSKKPYPEGLYKASELVGIPPEKILMVDDRLLTGCLAAVLAGAVPFYIRKPYVRIKGNLRAELFFMLLRHLERGYIRLIGWI